MGWKPADKIAVGELLIAHEAAAYTSPVCVRQCELVT